MFYRSFRKTYRSLDHTYLSLIGTAMAKLNIDFCQPSEWNIKSDVIWDDRRDVVHYEERIAKDTEGPRERITLGEIVRMAAG
jgi:hypothetical protein